MQRITTIAALRGALAPERKQGRRVALVPTMGALHEGHLALVDAARSSADLVVMSIFVNPLQFRPGEDFEQYPRNLEADQALAERRGVDLLFVPTVEAMYGMGDEVRVVPGESASLWEGAFRPGHFVGVLTVVAKLFNIVQPDVACFGQKDIQQAILIRQMIAQLDFPVELSVVPTVREPDGLALSSRNVYLTAADRAVAVLISQALLAAAARWKEGEPKAATLQEAVTTFLSQTAGLTVDYVAVVDGARMLPVERADAGTVIAVAARVGSTRLIDNIILGKQG